jgi:SAM-dependent methyltransferase
MMSETLPRLVQLMLGAERSLDVGGWDTSMNAATHVLDAMPFETRLGRAHDTGNAPRFSKATWLQRDINDRAPWPFPDKYFDFCMCSHVLEDVRDPVWVLSELSRVAKAGYLETPRPAAEILAGQRGLRPGSIGGAHHRWFVEFVPEQSRVEFRMKPYDLLKRGIALRYWTPVNDHAWLEFNQAMFWEGQVRGTEVFYSEETAYAYARSLLPVARALVKFEPMTRPLSILGRLLRRR